MFWYYIKSVSMYEKNLLNMVVVITESDRSTETHRKNPPTDSQVSKGRSINRKKSPQILYCDNWEQPVLTWYILIGSNAMNFDSYYIYHNRWDVAIWHEKWVSWPDYFTQMREKSRGWSFLEHSEHFWTTLWHHGPSYVTRTKSS